MNFFTNKKILVTGGTGHLGANLIHALVELMEVKPGNMRVFYLNNSPTEALNDLSGLDFFAGNVLNQHDITNACKDVDLVFHLIGSTTFDSRQKRLQWLVNVEGTRNVLEAVRNSKNIQKLCYTSTVNVLGIPQPVGGIGDFENSDPYKSKPSLHSFSSPQDTLNFIEKVHSDPDGDWEKNIGIGYYDSKLAAQELVNYYAKEYKLNVVSVLPGTMFGPYDHLIGTGMYLLSLYHNQMPVTLGGGFPLAHIEDVAEGHLLAMEKALPGAQYILSGKEDDNRYLKDMCTIIVEELRKKFPGKKFKAPAMIIPQWMARTAATVSERYAKAFNQPMLLSAEAVRAGAWPAFYTSAKARKELGYEPRLTFRQAIADMIDYYKHHGLFESKGRWIDKR